MISVDEVKQNNKNRFNIKPNILHLNNYWTLLSGKVESPSPLQPPIPPTKPETLNHINKTPVNNVYFQLPRNHTDKDSTAWRRIPWSRYRYAHRREEKFHQKQTCRAKPLTEAHIKCGALDGTILSAIFDAGTTSSAVMVGDPYTLTGMKSTKLFHMPNGSTTPISDVFKFKHKIQDPARTVDMLPGLINASLLRRINIVSAGYITVYDKKKVNV